MVHDDFYDAVHHIVENARRDERHYGHLRGREVLSHREHLGYGEHLCKRSVLNECDDFVRHRRQDALMDWMPPLKISAKYAA